MFVSADAIRQNAFSLFPDDYFNVDNIFNVRRRTHADGFWYKTPRRRREKSVQVRNPSVEHHVAASSHCPSTTPVEPSNPYDNNKRIMYIRLVPSVIITHVDLATFSKPITPSRRRRIIVSANYRPVRNDVFSACDIRLDVFRSFRRANTIDVASRPACPRHARRTKCFRRRRNMKRNFSVQRNWTVVVHRYTTTNRTYVRRVHNNVMELAVQVPLTL